MRIIQVREHQVSTIVVTGEFYIHINNENCDITRIEKRWPDTFDITEGEKQIALEAAMEKWASAPQV